MLPWRSMRPAWFLSVALAACSSDMSSSDGPIPDAPASSAADAPSRDAAAPDAASASPDAGSVATDLDMQVADFANLPLTMPSGRSYYVANLLGHEAEALAVATSATGGDFPVGTIVEVQRSEAMVKRRAGFDPTTNDWEFFGVDFDMNGKPTSFNLRGTESTACFMCHSMVSTVQWDYMCDHP